MSKATRVSAFVTVWVLLFGMTSVAFAHAFGVTSAEFAPASAGCNTSGCHSGGTTPTVSLTGPTSVAPSSTNTYTLQINNPAGQPSGGLNVSAIDGIFSTGGPSSANTQTLNNFITSRLEITHTSPKASVSNITTFTFQWTAPAVFSSVTLVGWGNAVNLSGTSLGDRAANSNLLISSNQSTNTPTATPTATATPTQTAPMHDSVVLPVAPLNITIPKKTLPTSKFFKVKVHVRNADAASEVLGDSITLTASAGDCPPGIQVGTPDFVPSTIPAEDTIAIPGGKTKTAVVPVIVDDADFLTFNHKTPTRCTLSFTATTNVPGNTDPTANNTATAEINVIDKNDVESASGPPHETVLRSLSPVTVGIAMHAASPKIKIVHPVVVNADILPAPDAGDNLAVSVDAATCPWITTGSLDMDSKTAGDQSSILVKGGKSHGGKLQLLIFPNAVTTTNPKSPARCTLTIHATGPTDPDPETSNNATTLTVDVIDHNDF